MRKENKLNPLSIRKATKPGLYGDGHGLYLQVSVFNTKSWIFRYMIDGKARKTGLGPLHTVSLAEARRRAADLRLKVLDRIDPIVERDASRAAKRIEAAKTASIPTFLQCADSYIDTKASEWSNAIHSQQWRRSFHPGPRGGAAPTARLNDLPVNVIDTPLILACLEPLWKATPTTASRIRGRIENILAFAKAKGYRTGDNPASPSLVEYVMPKSSKAAKDEHHAALPYKNMPSFMAELRTKEGTAARALEFVILTAARRGEVVGVRWSEIDLEARVWIVPPERMKARREHRVPLSDRAMAILAGLSRVNEFIFPGRSGKALSEMPMRALLAELRPEVTIHGMRSSFRDWSGDCTSFPREICEAALAHLTGNQVEQAYRRGTALEQRRLLMQAWATYCEGGKGGENVVPLRQSA
jgi:integrase